MRLIINTALSVIFLFATTTFSIANDTQVLQKTGLLKLRGYILQVSGVVAKISGNKVFISNDTGELPPIGINLDITRAGEVIKHPTTGEVLGKISEHVGTVTVKSANKKLITATIVNKENNLKVGDSVGSSFKQKPKVALIQTSLDKGLVIPGLRAALESWGEIEWVDQYLVNRFMHDEGIEHNQKSLPPNIIKLGREILGSDFIVLLHLKKGNGSVLTDATLYKTTTGSAAEKVVKGLVAIPGVASTVVAKKVPANQKLPYSEQKPGKTQTQSSFQKRSGKTKVLHEFDEGISGLATYDFDNDGKDEIVVSLRNSIQVFNEEGNGLMLLWERTFPKDNTIVGVCTGDFNGDGKGEIYVNNTVTSWIRSMVFEGNGSNFLLLQDQVKTIFYVNSDKHLYGRNQLDGFRLGLENDIYRITWANGSMHREFYTSLPNRGHKAGLGFSDIDKDGKDDVISYLGNQLIYQSSSSGAWEMVNGDFGGSNVRMSLSTEAETGGEINTKEFHMFIPSIQFFDSNGRIMAVNNKPLSRFISNPTYYEGQIVFLESDGNSLYRTGVAPMKANAIQGLTIYNGVNVLVGRTSVSFLSGEKGKLIMTDLNDMTVKPPVKLVQQPSGDVPGKVEYFPY